MAREKKRKVVNLLFHLGCLFYASCMSMHYMETVAIWAKKVHSLCSRQGPIANKRLLSLKLYFQLLT